MGSGQRLARGRKKGWIHRSGVTYLEGHPLVGEVSGLGLEAVDDRVCDATQERHQDHQDAERLPNGRAVDWGSEWTDWTQRQSEPGVDKLHRTGLPPSRDAGASSVPPSTVKVSEMVSPLYSRYVAMTATAVARKLSPI